MTINICEHKQLSNIMKVYRQFYTVLHNMDAYPRGNSLGGCSLWQKENFMLRL